MYIASTPESLFYKVSSRSVLLLNKGHSVIINLQSRDIHIIFEFISQKKFLFQEKRNKNSKIWSRYFLEKEKKRIIKLTYRDSILSKIIMSQFLISATGTNCLSSKTAVIFLTPSCTRVLSSISSTLGPTHNHSTSKSGCEFTASTQNLSCSVELNSSAQALQLCPIEFSMHVS